MSDKIPDFIVIGAGIVGVSCALYLQREGFAVALLERGAPGDGASAGNAGSLGTASIPPTGMPGLTRRVPGMLIDPLSPLVIRWRHLLRLLPWLLRLLRNSTPARVEAIADARAALLARVYGAYEPLLADAGLAELRRRVGKLLAYENETSLDREGYALDLRRRRGVPLAILDGDEARQIEPALGPRIAAAVHLPEVDYIANPLRLTRGLAAHFVQRGGRRIQDSVRGFAASGSDVAAVIGDSDRYPCHNLVIAAGAWSRPLARELGTHLPIEAERGYNVTLPAMLGRFRVPVTLMERHVSLTPMEDGLRLTGMSEFAGLDAPADMRKPEIVLENARAAIPGLDGGEAMFWSGPRPSLPDSVPAIGRSRRRGNVFYACGHDHLGLTMGPLTGRLIADLAAGRDPGLDMRPYAPDRFG
jgi:D-amino-acid dehydrogenase